MSRRLDGAGVRAERLARHGLTRPAADEAAFVELFRRLQPVSPEANSYPGSPPRLLHRVAPGAGTDDAVADDLRARRRLRKGRFHGGSVGYVHVDDLPLFAAAYRQPLTRVDERQQAVLDAFEREGPLSPRQLRHETGLAHRPLMAAVHRLERAFVVCEDQTDDAWDRPLHLWEREAPGLWERAPAPRQAVAEVVARRLAAQVAATTGQLADGTGLGRRKVEGALRDLVEAGRVEAAAWDDGPWGGGVVAGWRLRGDEPAASPATLVRVLHTADPLARPRATEGRRRYEGREVLQWLLIGDDLRGAACGHWRIRPHDVEDVVFDEGCQRWRDEVLEAVRRRYPPPERRLLACNGEPL